MALITDPTALCETPTQVHQSISGSANQPSCSALHPGAATLEVPRSSELEVGLPANVPLPLLPLPSAPPRATGVGTDEGALDAGGGDGTVDGGALLLPEPADEATGEGADGVVGVEVESSSVAVDHRHPISCSQVDFESKSEQGVMSPTH